MSLTPNSTFGIYKIGEVIGTGGMGEVYRATDTTLDRQVAIKVLPAAFAEDADRVARFEREAKTLATLNHPNIAQIYGLERQGDTIAIVMELVEGPTLADRIAQGPIPADEALRIAKQLIDGLEAAHNKSIVHRDLKPANIKVKADGSVKILDFGIAKPIDIQGASGSHTPTQITPAVTETGVIMGTAAYMSPEQARGRFVDERTDVWAFGCVLFEMLTGQPAFAGEDVAQTLARIIALDTDFNSLPGIVSPSVRHTIKLCLEKEPKKRIADIRDVRLAMDGVFETDLPRAVQQQAAKSLWKRLVPIAASVVVTAVVTSLFFLESPAPARPVEVRRSVQALPAGQTLTTTALRNIAMSNDDSQLVYAANGALYIRDMNELEPRLLAGTEGEVALTPYFSPNGEWIAYIAGGNSLKKVSTEGGTPLPILNEFPQGGFNWVDDDTLMYVNENEIRTISANGGEPQAVFTDAPGYSPISPKFLPGNKNVLFQRTSPDGSINEVAIGSVATGELIRQFPGSLPLFHEAGYVFYFDDTLGLLARAVDFDTGEIGSPIAMVSDVLRAQENAGSPQFNVSANGSLLYVKGGVNTGGSQFLGIGDEDRILRQFDVPLNIYQWPSVSPDGTQVAVQSNGQIYIYRLDGNTEIRQLTRDGNNIHPAWTPDGQYITYSSDRDGTRHIWQQRADGSGVAEALTAGNEGRPQIMPAWAPDGRLVYTAPSEEGEGNDIWIISLPLGEPELLIGGTGNQAQPQFSANGQAMVYQSNESGGPEVYVSPFPPDGSSTRVSLAGVQSGYAFWSRQGSSIYYAYAGTGTGSIAALDITIPGFAITNRRELPYNTLPDARRLDSIPGTDELLLALPASQNVAGRTGGSDTELIFVENWIEEVKQRVPPIRSN